MAQNAFVQSMKTIAESLIRKAGFDKTRSGKVVGVNSLTNTYSVKVDGHVYNNVRVVNDSTYNVGDTVRVNMPVNQPSQLYISASIYSDSSIGKKIGHAERLIDEADREITDIREIMGKIYQLSIRSEYSATGVTHYGVLMQNGEDVTSPEYTVDFHWYLQRTEGKTAIGTGEMVTLSTEAFLYGQSVLLEWEVDGNVMLRAQVILFDDTKVEDVADKAYDAYDIATNEAQYFWFNEDVGDNGAHISYYRKDDFESNPRGHNLLANADGVAIRQGVGTLSAFSADGMHVNGMLNNQLQSLANFTKDGIWFNEGIGYTIGNDGAYVKYVYDNGWKIKISADQIILGNQPVATTDMIIQDIPYLTEISTGGLFVHRNDSGYAGSDPSSSTAYGVKLASTVDIIRAGKSLATFDTSAVTFRTSNGYKTAEVGTSGFTLYRGVADANNYAVASFTGSGMTLKNASNVNTLVSNSSGLTIYNGSTSTNVALASFSASGITLKNSSNLTTFTAGANSMTMYSGSGSNYALASFGSGGMTLRNTSGYYTCYISASSFTLYDGSSSQRQIALFNTSGMTLKNSSGYTLCTVSGSGASFNNSSGTTLCNISTSGMTIYNSSGYQLANFGSTATIGQTSSYNLYFYSGTLNFRYGSTTTGYINSNTSGTYMTIKSNGRAVYSSDGNMQINSQSSTDADSSGNGALVVWAVYGGLGLHSKAAGLVFRNTTSSGGYGIIRPDGDQSDIFGTTSNRWWKVYTYGVDTGSDRKLKDITGNISFAKDFIMSLNPVEFMWKNGDHRRTRMGFIAQEVAEWAKNHNLNLSVYSASFKDDDDMTAYYGEDVDDEKLIWSMEYEQLIAPAIKVIQEQQHIIDDLTQRIEALERK